MTFSEYLTELAELSKRFSQDNEKEITRAKELFCETLAHGKKILFCGNGGSSADAAHLCAELVGRYKTDRKAYPAICLSSDLSSVTAISNDYGYKNVFSRILEGLANEGDMLIALSTSGNSPNIINAIMTAKKKHVNVLGMTGETGGKMINICDVLLKVPTKKTNYIQEIHMSIGHYLCESLETINV